MKRIGAAVAVLAILVAALLLRPRPEGEWPAGEAMTLAGCDYEPAAQWISMRAEREGARRPALVMSFRPGAKLPDGAPATHAGLMGYLAQMGGSIGKDGRLAGVLLPPADLGDGRVSFAGPQPSAAAAHALRELLPGVFDPEADARRAMDRRREYLVGKGLHPAELSEGVSVETALARRKVSAGFTTTPPPGVPYAAAHVDLVTLAVFNRGREGGKREILCQEGDRAAASAMGGGEVRVMPPGEFRKSLAERRFDVAVVSVLRGKGADGLDHAGSSVVWDLLMQSLPADVRGRGLEGGFPSDVPIRLLRTVPLYVAGSPEALRKLGLGFQGP